MAASETASNPLRLNEVLKISAGLGALYGFLEGLLDLTVQHYHAEAIAPVLFLIGTACFILGGTALWLLAHLLPGGWRRPVVFFLLQFTAAFGLLPLLTTQQMSRGMRLLLSMALVLLASAVWDRLERVFVRGLVQWVVGLGVVELALFGLGSVRAVAGAGQTQPAKMSMHSPSVLFVMLDAVRADHLGCYGYQRQTSPTMDRLARRGVLFEMAIAPSSWSLPTTASLLTGTYPHTHHVDRMGHELPDEALTLAEVFRQQGYRSAAFSGDRFMFSRMTNMGQGFDLFGDYFLNLTDTLSQEKLVQVINGRLRALGLVEDTWGRPRAEEINQAALRWLDRTRGDAPFFLAVKYYDAHDPYVPPQPWRHRFSDKPAPGGKLGEWWRHVPHLTPEQLQDEMDAYDGGIAYADHALGELLASLERRGLLENTLVVLTADHGEMFGEHGLVGHTNALWLPVIRVPLIFWWPGRLPAGARIDVPVSTRDVGATILDVTANRSNHFAGNSLAALWRGTRAEGGWPLPLSELARLKLAPEFPDYWGPLVSIVSSRFHYIEDPRQGPLLFDWKQDPGETHNLVADPAYTSTAAALKAALAQELRQSP